MSKSPYEGLPPRNYWRSAIGQRHPLAPYDIYRKKFDITRDDRVATAGSCFAQHIARHLRKRGFQVIDEEPKPEGLPDRLATQYGFDLYSARYGNVYTARQMVQLIEEAEGKWTPAEAIWERDGRYFDALRPNIEPQGLESVEEVQALRADHLRAVRAVLRKATLMVFTMGLTETWMHTESGTVYPTAPGTIAGSHDPRAIGFHNFTFAETYTDIVRLRALLHEYNPHMRMLLTVSPVPLTATATDDNVLVATTYSKSVLRAVAGEVSRSFDDVDYFPSYEIIAGHPSRGFFYEANLRSVADEGVEVVMHTFLAEHDPGATPMAVSGEQSPTTADAAEATAPADADAAREQVVCEEALLEAFGT